MFCVKDQILNILGFAGHMVSVPTIHLCCCTTKAVIGKCVHESVWLCFSQTLFTQKDSWIRSMGHSLMSPVLDGIVYL